MNLSTELPTILGCVAILFSALAWLYALKAWELCNRMAKYLDKIRPDKPPGAKRLTEIECELTELTDSLVAIHASMKKLRARVGMRENRAKKNDEQDGVPDPVADPGGYKRAMRLKLRSTGQL